MTKKFIGYTADVELPFKRGDTVVIPKGTIVYSRFPTTKAEPTKRKQTVKIHHIMPGQNVPEADYLRDYKYIVDNAPLITDNYGRKVYATYNPRIVWAGAGGYWKEVDVNDLIGEDNG